MSKFKTAGRPAGKANKRSGQLRSQETNIRCSEGFNETIKMLVATGNYSSKADVLHEALQQLAFKKLTDKKGIFWANKI